MTTLGGLTDPARADLLRKLRRAAGEWLQRFYRRDILVARATRGIQLSAVDAFEREVVRPLLRSVGAGLAGIDARGLDVTPDTSPALAAVVREAETIIERGAAAVRSLTQHGLRTLAQDEAKWVATGIERTTGVSVLPANAAPSADRPWLGDSTERWFRKMLETPTADRVRQTIVQGVQQGQTTDQIVKAIRGSGDQVGLLDAPRRAVQVLVRTAATSTAANASMDSFAAIGVTKWRFLATLDQKTSVQCAAADGKVFPIGRGPLPPLHPNCRSRPVPYFGEPIGTRASIDGQVPADKTFEEWLQERPIAEQDDILGRAKAKAWRAGALSLDDMLGRDLQPLTLAELRDMGRL